jgi:TolA-binding protein
MGLLDRLGLGAVLRGASPFVNVSVALALMSATVLTASAAGQSPAARQHSKATVPESTSGSAGKKAAADASKSKDLESELEAMKMENAAVRDLLRKMEEQQKILLEQVDSLRRRLDAGAATDASTAAQPIVPLAPPEALVSAAPAAPTTPQPATASAATSPPPSTVAAQAAAAERYRDGMVIWQTAEDASVPFLLKFNVNTQLRYLNTLSSDETFTDHLGVVRDVHTRNDITVNRAMFILGGYVFDPRLRYSFTVWTSAGAASIVVAGNIGWQFSKALAITGGYTGVPGSRSLVATFPFYSAIDRSMADNFFRPGFTQGVWANGELSKGLNYLVFVGNGLNTLNISANKIDTHLLGSGSLWWEPMGPYGEPGKARNMYDDYYSSRKTRIRLGTSYTRSREDRFSNLDQSSPENTSLYNSDGVLTFSTGAFAPGVTVDQATYRMWAIDGGLKRSGFSVNAQYFFRWLNDFEADGLLPFESMLDHGFELTAGHFVVPRKVQLHARASGVFGEFRDSSEYGGGVKWYFLPTERIWITAEMIKVDDVPYSGAFTPYTAGMNGWTPMIQTVLAF